MLNPLKTGDKVAIVATAKRLEKSIEEAISIIESWSLEVVLGTHVMGSDEYWAASNKHRLSNLQEALDSSEVKAIIFARGGYGTTKILDQVDFSTFRANPKWTVGFSDLTSFLLQTGTMGVPSVHGPMAYTIGNDDESDGQLRQLLFGERKFSASLSANELTKQGQVEGQITGGNLYLICESIGAKNEIDTDGKVLFLEEVGEDFYAVDRMLNKLKRIGKFENLKGVLVGDFTNVRDSNGYFTRSLNELILSYFDDLECPIAFGFPAGHEAKNIPLVFHQNAKIHIGEGSILIEYLD